MNRIEQMIKCSEMDTKDPKCSECKNKFVIRDLDILEDCKYIMEEL